MICGLLFVFTLKASERKHPGTELDGEIAVRTKRILLEYDQYGAYLQDKQRKL